MSESLDAFRAFAKEHALHKLTLRLKKADVLASAVLEKSKLLGRLVVVYLLKLISFKRKTKLPRIQKNRLNRKSNVTE